MLEIPEWPLGSVGSQSRHQKHRPPSAMLGQLSLDLSRNRQAAASKTTPDSAGAASFVSLAGFARPPCPVPYTALERGCFKFSPAPSEPS